MNSQRWQQIEEIFQAALDCSEAERERLLAERCADDAELRSEVEKLLADFDSAEDFIESPVWTDTDLMNSAVRKKLDKALENQQARNDSPLGRRVGVYDLKAEIGRGGMGAVYLGERADGEFRQKVAVKLIKRGMDTDFVLSRFRRERQILANLNHPNIVLLLDGGTTDDGLPYFVMDYVEGEPLTRYVKNENLSLPQKIELFIKVCEAVDYAHQKNIVHRDLKPSNILVNQSAVPKLLDFGIAKLLDPDLSDDTYLPTETQMRLMTPEYASPEQITGGAVTQLTDVYSLGVMLYEIVTGTRPYKFTNRSPIEIARVINESKFIRPSRFLMGNDSAISENKTAKAKNEETPVDLQFENLDRIIYRALQKNPERRYQSAAALAEDLHSYLENQTVSAEALPPEQRTARKKSGKKSVAILPFKIIGGGEENTEDLFLGIGLADALVSRLSGVQRLIVRPTSSVMPFANENPIEAGKKIGVDFVLDGNIRRIGGRIRVTAQLLNVAEGATRWAEKFDELTAGVLELEDLISERVAKVLLPQLTGEEKRRLEKRGTNIPEAYQAYLRGRYFINQFSDEALKKAIEAYREAIRLDPAYAAPRVGMADFYVWSSIFGEMPTPEAFPQAKKYAEDALKYDEYSGEAYAILAFIKLLYEWDWEEAEKLCKRALELNPNYHFAHECYSNILVTSGNFEQGITEIKRAEELDPLSPRARLMTAWVLYQTQQFEESVAKCEQVNEMQSDFPQGLLHSGNAKAHVGRADEAVAELRRCVELWNSGLPKHLYCYALVADGNIAEARSVLEELKETARTGFLKPYFLAAAHVALSEFDEAFEWLEKSVGTRDEWLIWLATDPKLDELRRDERYSKILSRINSPLTARSLEATTGDSAARIIKSIAVLPFKFIGIENTGDSDDEYLSIGLADALTMRLSNVRRFIVRPTNSVIGFAEREIDSFQAGRELGVDYILDGNIRRVGNRFRVAAQLLNVEDNSTNWAERFDEDLMDVLALEDSISERVTKLLLPRLSDEEQRRLARRGTASPEAYDALMKARFYFNQFAPDTYPKALELAEKAAELDPNYALAHASIAQFYNWASIFGMIPPVIGLEKTKKAAYKAIELDDKLSEAYSSLGFMVAYAEWKWEEGESHFRKAIELNPNNPLAYEWYAVSHAAHGRIEEGVKAIRRAEMLDPLSPRQMILTAWTLYQLHQFEDALSKAREVIELIPDYWQGYTQAGNALVELGRAGEAVEMLKTAVKLAPGLIIPQYKLCAALARAGTIQEAREVLREIESEPANLENSSYLVAVANAVVGEADRAFELLHKAVESHDLWMVWVATEPKIDNLRHDPRFKAILGKINLKSLN